VTASDQLSPAEKASALDARAVSYFRHRDLARPIVEINGWDMGALDRIVESGLDRVEQETRGVEEARRQLAAAVSLLPPEWLTAGAAVGTTEQCAARLHAFRQAGADEILIHGSTPDRLEGIVKAYAAMA
jgi:alkanesulfonate monooxygenase SsuD/methylene tetrahydromethanopterin reductase-like flavin-dependent oxidoreductase (luciferase family)